MIYAIWLINQLCAGVIVPSFAHYLYVSIEKKESHIFRVKDLEFGVSSACLDAFIDEDSNQLIWGLRIDADSLNDEIRNQISFEAETLLPTSPFQIKSIDDFTGMKVEWTEPEDEDGEAFALLNLFQHSPVSKAKIEFHNNSDGALVVQIQATSDLFWKDSYREDLELEIECPIIFKNILMGRNSEEISWKIISKYFDNAEQIFQFKQDEYGVSTLGLKEQNQQTRW